MTALRALGAGLFAMAFTLVATSAHAQGLGAFRVGVLQFGTVNWELDVIREHRLDAAEGFVLEAQPYASTQATQVAFQGGAVDAIVADWLWVSRQRSVGRDFTFAPYSTSVGSLMVPPDSGARSLADLRGKTLGVAGGPLDKGWLLLRGLGRERDGVDLAAETEPVYGAPPLLNQKALSGELDAVMTYWNYAAKLEAAGFRRLVGYAEAARVLGVREAMPQIGYVFRESLARESPGLVAAFLRASRAAKRLLATSATEWERLRPLIKPKDDREFAVLRDRYREGIPGPFGAAERAGAARLYDALAKLGGPELVGPADRLAEGTFYADPQG